MTRILRLLQKACRRYSLGDSSTAEAPAAIGALKYDQRLKNEIRHYTTLLNGNDTGDPDDVQGCLPNISAFTYAMERYGPYLQSIMQNLNLQAYLLRRQQHLGSRGQLLSLGCGAGEWEIGLARLSGNRIDLHLIDLSMDLMRKAEAVGSGEGIHVHVAVEDVNRMRLPARRYDFVLCRSSLHHFAELEHVLDQVRRALRPGGELVIIGEWIGRNGLQLYPETEQAAQAIFHELPEHLRLNRYTDRVDTRVPNIDHSVNSFEAIRSEDLMPALLDRFKAVEYVTYDAFVSLLLDFRYGPNYDLSNPTDRRWADTIIEQDIDAIQRGALKPTAMCGIFTA